MKSTALRSKSKGLIAWVLAGLILSLSGCGTSPQKPPTLDVKDPSIPIPEQVLERDKPLSSMTPCDELEPLPTDLITRPEFEQAKYLLAEEISFINVYSECAIKQAALAEWINQE